MGVFLTGIPLILEEMEFHFCFDCKYFMSNFGLFANKLQRNSEKQSHLIRNHRHFHLFAKKLSRRRRISILCGAQLNGVSGVTFRYAVQTRILWILNIGIFLYSKSGLANVCFGRCISSRPRLLNFEVFGRVVLSVTETLLGTGIRSLKMPARESWPISIVVTSVPRVRGAGWGLRGRQKWFVGEVGVLFVRNSW